MLAAIIKGPTFSSAYAEIKQAHLFADLFELRIDTFSQWTVAEVANLRSSLVRPVIFTLRKKEAGGESLFKRNERIALIQKLLELKPDYFDIEADEGEEFFCTLKKQHPEVKLIASYHDFQTMPQDLSSLLSSMPHKGVDLHKIAAHASSSLDGMRMLNFIKNASTPVIGIAMSERGQFSRILSCVFGNAMVYGYAKKEGEEGQISLQDLVEIYRIRNLDQNTKIYALLGGNVERSRSHLFHNAYFHDHGKNAVYVKISLGEHELATFLQMAKKLSFRGMSVTMPLKEKILPHLDRVDVNAKKIGAVNTLYLDESHWVGLNVDGKGVLDAIEKKVSVKNKRLFVLGSGGFARAILFEAIKRKAYVALISRNEKKREEFASYFHIPSYDLKEIDYILQQKGYDILINATPNGMKPEEEELFVHTFSPGSLIVEGVNNAETLLLKTAKERGVECISGQELFRSQAYLQQQIWD